MKRPKKVGYYWYIQTQNTECDEWNVCRIYKHGVNNYLCISTEDGQEHPLKNFLMAHGVDYLPVLFIPIEAPELPSEW
jgi:hypothetical protein